MIKNDNEETKMNIEENKDMQEKVEETQEDALGQCKVECAEWKDKYLHLSADFQNYKKRLVQERAEWGYEAQKHIILDLLAVLDNFERALEQEKKHEYAGAESLLAGISLIHQELEKVLHKYGVKEITERNSFNPEYHEALMHVDSPEHSTGDIVQIIQKGYTFKDHVLRPAKVSVAK